MANGKKTNWWLIGGIGCAVVLVLGVLCCGGFGLFGWRTLNAADPAANQFLDQIQAGNYSSAYDMLATSTQSQTSREEFVEELTAIESASGRLQSRTKTGYNASVDNNGNRRDYTYSGTFTNGTRQIKLILLEQNGTWVVEQYHFSR